MENLFLAFVLSCFIVDTSVFIESTGTWTVHHEYMYNVM